MEPNTPSLPVPKPLRVFLASPGDVWKEREEALKILADLSGDPILRDKITLEPVAWEINGGVPLSAWVSPQDAVKKHLPWPSQCDIVLVILWSRLGTPLPESEGVKPDGSPYLSGTEWEYLNAKQTRGPDGRPEILVYRRTEKVLIDADEPDFAERIAQRQKVKDFFSCFQNPDGSIRGIKDYADPAEFKDKLLNDLKFTIKHWLPGESKATQHEPPPTDHSAAIRRYLDYVQDTHRYLSFRGMGFAERVPLRLPLVDLFVPLKARLELPHGEAWNRRLKLAGRTLDDVELQAEALRLGEPTPVLDLLRQHDGLVILGDPGAGKTTFLKYLALRLAAGEYTALGLGSRLPVLVPLSAYANALEAKPQRLDDFIAGYFHDLGGDWPIAAMLAQAFDQGEALVLLDGLDEVADASLRQDVVDRVIHFYTIHRKNGNKFVLTSRIVGYRDIRPQAPGLAEATLVDFDDAEISEFAERWTLALETQAQGGSRQADHDARHERQGLLDAVRLNPGVRLLATNPLLLTILALMKRDNISLPERRVDLYEQCVKTLLSTWNRARSLGLARASSREPDLGRTVKMLAPLALWMHEVNPGVGLVKREDLRRKLESLYRERGEADPETSARLFLADVREPTSILVERGHGEFGFIHLTFEEYLAAVAIALDGQGDAPTITEALSGKVGQPAWHEIIRLALGYIGLVQQLDGVAGKIVEALVSAQPGPPGEAVVLAGEAVADLWPAAGVSQAGYDCVTIALEKTMQAPEVPGNHRRRCGWLLGKLGWQPGDLDRFVEVSPGQFLYGDNKQLREIPYRFWISQYPVTNSQFARFIQAGGYQQRKYWTQTGWAWAQQNAITLPWYCEDSDWNNPIFPVVGVSWHEAMAYAAWLDEALVEQGFIVDEQRIAKPDGYVIRLPAEWEWERAARGVDGREYPWDDGFLVANANTADETWNSITEGTTAVCTYPQGVSPTGAWDLAGNVWEWCVTNYTHSTDPGREGEHSRVLRGGSWYDDPHYARAAYRFLNPPDGRLDYLGFRLVCSSPIADN